MPPQEDIQALRKVLACIKKGQRIPKKTYTLLMASYHIPRRIKNRLQKYHAHFMTGGIQSEWTCHPIDVNNFPSCEFDVLEPQQLGEGACGKVIKVNANMVVKINESLEDQAYTYLREQLPVIFAHYNSCTNANLYYFMQSNDETKTIRYAMPIMRPIIIPFPDDKGLYINVYNNLLDLLLNLVDKFHDECKMIHFDCKMDNAMFLVDSNTPKNLKERLINHTYIIDIDGAISMDAIKNNTVSSLYNSYFHPYTPMYAHPHIIFKYNSLNQDQYYKGMYNNTKVYDNLWDMHDRFRSILNYSRPDVEETLKHKKYHEAIFPGSTMDHLSTCTNVINRLRFCDLYSMAMSVLSLAHSKASDFFDDLENYTCKALHHRAAELELIGLTGGATSAHNTTSIPNSMKNLHSQSSVQRELQQSDEHENLVIGFGRRTVQYYNVEEEEDLDYNDMYVNDKT